ncbi:MAG TPA: molybdopterin-dependent oxidoreductase [Steroidobacteraceae bacterium]|nr:molybdopterin-dependent oxidoreductase [Steroidobacteraceae bacterium]
MATRRALLMAAGGWVLGGTGALRLARAALPSGAADPQTLEAIAGKKPLIRRSGRPPNYECPAAYLGEAITPNDRFFVRWHLAHVPEVDARSWRLQVAGEAAGRSFELSLDQLRHEFEPVELIAVCQCAGNQRGLAEPHVPGVQWGPGAVGNAHWKGVRLKDILARAQVKADALEIAFEGADGPVLPATPDFTKSLPVWKALDENTLIAYEMNGSALPRWNGFPVRVIVPGWAATYWVKQLTEIHVLNQPLKSFWMNTAYRVPKGKFPVGDRFESQENETSTPVLEIDVNSVVSNVKAGQRFPARRPLTIQGVAWDSGGGIQQVDISLDGGQSWNPAKLGKDLGRYSFRPWHFTYTPERPGPGSVMARATSSRGAVQPQDWTSNPAGYHNNSLQKIDFAVI